VFSVALLCSYPITGCVPDQIDISRANFDETFIEQASDCSEDELAEHKPPAPDLRADKAKEPSEKRFLTATSSVDLLEWLVQIVSALPGPGSEGLLIPSGLELSDFGDSVDSLLAGDVRRAAASAELAGYRIAVIMDLGNDGELLHALVPSPGNEDGRGYYIVRPAASVVRELVIEAPHPRFDGETGRISADLFRKSGARTLAVAGTHRCANSRATQDDGETRVCNHGAWGPYRESDMAHSGDSFFQLFHEIASTEHPRTVTVQLHGFNERDSLPEFSISDGTREDVEDDDYLPNRLSAALEARILAAGSLRQANCCNRSGDINLLCGTANSQAGFSNRIPAACAAPTASGRFIHLELSRELRYPGGILEPHLAVEAIIEVFPTK